MKPLDKGTYYYLPILQRSIDKTIKIIDRFMHKIGASKISIPNLTPVELWKNSGSYWPLFISIYLCAVIRPSEVEFFFFEIEEFFFLNRPIW